MKVNKELIIKGYLVMKNILIYFLDRSWRSDFLRHISYEINNNHLFIIYGFNLDIYEL